MGIYLLYLTHFISMKHLPSVLAAVIITLFMVLLLFSSSQVYSQEIESNHFIHYAGNVYISPQINILIRSTGEIEWSQNHQSTHFYLIPAGKLSEITDGNPAGLAIKPVKYAGGPDTYLYQGLKGSYYVVAVANSNPSSFASYYFSHPPYVADPLIGGPSSYNAGLEVFYISIAMVTVGFAMLLAFPAYNRARSIRISGGSLFPAVLNRVKASAYVWRRALKMHMISAVLVAIAVLFTGFSLAQSTSVPPVLPEISTHSFTNSSLIPAGYTYNLDFNESSPLVSSVYNAFFMGPLPVEGGINSSQIYNYGYLITITKVSEKPSISEVHQTIVIKSVNVSIGNMTLPFTPNNWDSGLEYYNGALITDPSGTYDNGTQFGLYIMPTNEMSLGIGDGNYTMHVNITLSPVTVLGIYHYSGLQNTISLSYPVYVNNSKTVSP